MLLRLLIALLVFSSWGCESLSSSHHTIENTHQGQSKSVRAASLKAEVKESLAPIKQSLPPDKVLENSNTREAARAEPFPTIYFPFNSWEITSDVQERLDATAKWMSHFSTYGLTIEGHTDVRGSEGYNMVLGVRRAKAVKDYLSTLGIPRTRLDIVSYGNTLVLCDVDDEHRCHQYNRRADLLLE